MVEDSGDFMGDLVLGGMMPTGKGGTTGEARGSKHVSNQTLLPGTAQLSLKMSQASFQR